MNQGFHLSGFFPESWERNKTKQNEAKNQHTKQNKTLLLWENGNTREITKLLQFFFPQPSLVCRQDRTVGKALKGKSILHGGWEIRGNGSHGALGNVI